MTVSSIRRATTLVGPRDLALLDGRVVPDDQRLPRGTSVDVAGALVLPAFVDAHVHLDKAYLLRAADAAPAGTGVHGAITATQRARAALDPDQQVEAARKGCDALVRNGVVAARAHVEIDATTGLDLLPLHRDLQEELAGTLDLQLTAFPQHGIDRVVRQLLESALKDGAEVVAGCPYVDDDQEEHLDVVFDLADRHGRPVDLHLDFDDDPTGSMIAAVATRTRALGLQGTVTVGHVTKLAAMAPDEQRRMLDTMAAADIALVVMPATDLFLNGSGEPGTRSMAPVERALSAGVRVAISNNNLYNAFSPYGNGSLLQAAWAAGLVRRMASTEEQDALLAAITTVPGAILGRDPHGPEVGAVADLVVLDTDDPADLVLRTPPVLGTLKAGRLVHARPALEVHDEGEER